MPVTLTDLAICTLDELWINLSHLGQPYPEALCDIGSWHSTHYCNDQMKYEGIIAELYNFIPSHFHKQLILRNIVIICQKLSNILNFYAS